MAALVPIGPNTQSVSLQRKKKQQKRVGRAATTTLDVRRTKKTSISRVMMKIVAFYKYISSPFLR
jgi:hypothetical protein